MTYPEAVDVLFSQLPMFQRQGAAAYKADLSATKRVCAALGHPERKLKFVHVAGTNGKGTVCHMVAAALQCAGHRVGLFTSPHLVDFRERIRVDGGMIPEADVVAFVHRWQEEDWGTPSFFELTFGMALDHFVRSECDIVVLETGMGGRLDSTNVVPTAEACAITNIGLDHQQFLGPDIRSIAKEKAGILKDGVPVVLGSMRPEAQSEILAAALRSSSEMHFALERVQDMPSREVGEKAPWMRSTGPRRLPCWRCLKPQGGHVLAQPWKRASGTTPSIQVNKAAGRSCPNPSSHGWCWTEGTTWTG